MDYDKKCCEAKLFAVFSLSLEDETLPLKQLAGNRNEFLARIDIQCEVLLI